LEARQVFASATADGDARPPGVSDDFENLRWFELPAGCLA
jgi:hypothetical protein